MSTQEFFSEQSEQSKIKSAIVAKYFDAWSSVIMGAQDRRSGPIMLAYIDLFAGPGRYEDGTSSTPLQILEKAISNDKLRDRLVTFFNDSDGTAAERLREVIGQIHGVETLRVTPEVHNFEVGQDVADWLNSGRKVPSLFFLDPWGYRGLSLSLVDATTRDWGCDTILFFNYNRVNMGLNNPAVEERMKAIFDDQRFYELCAKVTGLSPRDRELAVIEELCDALADGSRYVLPFGFKDDRGTRTSHHLFLVTKNSTGYGIMKEIMAKESSRAEQGVASFEYDPLDLREVRQFPLLAGLAPRPLDELSSTLLETYAGRTMTMKEIYVDHNVGRPYIESNYKRALLKLEGDGKIVASEHRKNTFGGHVQVTFPAV